MFFFRRKKAIRGIKKFILTLCCCIKQRCVTWLEQKSRPQPKKDEIVKEILAELERVEAGKPESVAGMYHLIQFCGNYYGNRGKYYPTIKRGILDFCKQNHNLGLYI